MELFANLKPQEMEALLKDIGQMLGDDPDTIAEIQKLMATVAQQEAPEAKKTLEQIMREADKVKKKKRAKSQGMDWVFDTEWETVWANQEEILQVILESGELNPEEGELFQRDTGAWEEQLKGIWAAMQAEAEMKARMQANEL